MANDANLVINVTDKGTIKKSEKDLKGLTKEGKKAETQFKSFGKNAAAAVAAIDGPLGGVSSRVSSLTTVLSSGTAAITATALAVTGLTASLFKGVIALDEYEVGLRRTEQILKNTGFAAGLTAEQLREQADALGRATLSNTQEIQAAQAQLATFNRVAGDTFTRTIELSQDLAESGFGSVTSAAVGLGKALQDPINGMVLLTKQGSLTKDEQKEIAKAFEETNDLAAAQGAILDAIANQVGGAGVAVAVDTLAGSWDTFADALEKFNAAGAESTGVGNGIRFLLDTMSVGLDNLTESLDRNSEAGFTALVKRREELKDQLALSKESFAQGILFPVENVQRELDKANAAIKEVQDAQVARLKSQSDAQQKSAALQTSLEEKQATAKEAIDNAIAERAAAKAQVKIDQLASLNLTELELINKQETDRLAIIASFREQEGILQSDLDAAEAEIELNATVRRRELRAAELEEIIASEEEKKAIQQKVLDDQVKAEEEANKKKKQQEKDYFDSSVSLITALGGAQSKAAKAALLTSQLYAQKELIINNAEALGEAWASGPFPQNLPAVGAATAAFLPLFATVASARAQGGGLAAVSYTHLTLPTTPYV